MKMETQHIKTYRGYTKSSSREEFIEINVYIKKQAISAAQNSTFKKKYHGIRSLHSWQIDGEKVETETDFLGLQNHCRR